MKTLALSAISLLFLACGQSSIPTTEDRTGLNLDFEQVGASNTPAKWYVPTQESYTGSLDSQIATSGNRSYRIDFITQAEPHAFGVGTSNLPVDDVRGKKITYLGYIRTDKLTEGYAGLWFRVDGPGDSRGSLAFDNMNDRGVRGTTEWKQYKIELPVDSTAININFGVLHTGKGTAWFDKLEILVDGKPYERKLFAATDDQIEWLRQTAHPFNTPVAGSGFDDLAAVKEIVGNAEIVGLGEATHGTKEFFQMKHRLTEYLAANMGYTIFAIEANMPEAYKINDYVLGGPGNVRELMKGMYFWTWNTKEVEAMIEWMRAYNVSGKGRIEFTGFDMQTETVAADNVIAFLKKHDPLYAETARVKYDTLKNQIVKVQKLSYQDRYGNQNFAAYTNDALEVLTHMKMADYQKKTSPQEADWAIQNANVVLQAANLTLNPTYEYNYRDSCMAANVQWIKDRAPAKAKLVLWAHNRHVWNYDGMMGGYLKKWYADKYRVFGFKFHEGTYTAWGNGTVNSANVALPSYPGTLDWIFHSTKIPRFILNLQKTSANDPQSGWLHQSLETKDIGAMATDGYAPQKIAREYDAIIFFDKTTASECYGRTRGQ